MLIRYLLAWLPMVGLAIFNGVLREVTYGRTLTELHAHQLSTVMLILVFSVYVWLLDLLWPLQNSRQAALVGAGWLLLTILFEVAIGRLFSDYSWQQLLQMYNLFAGSLWPLLLAAIATLPWAVFWLRSRYFSL